MQQGNPLAGITFDQTSGIICEKCKNNTFSEAYLLRKVSKFLLASNSDKDQVIPVPVFQCTKCKHVNREFLPSGLYETSETEGPESSK